MDYLYETPEPSRALVIILITAFATVTITGVFFFQFGMDALYQKNSGVYESDSVKTLHQQLKLIKRQLRRAEKPIVEPKVSAANKNTLLNQRKLTGGDLNGKKTNRAGKYEPAIMALKTEIRLLQTSLQDQKHRLDSCLAAKSSY